jgi:hypothetical protein
MPHNSSLTPMPEIKVKITQFVHADQPGFVECQFVDANDRVWLFIEKIPVVTTEKLGFDSEYPRNGAIACEAVSRAMDGIGEIVIVDTTRPWGVESTDGVTRFEIRLGDLVE